LLDEMREDIIDECSKYGKVLNVVIDPKFEG